MSEMKKIEKNHLYINKFLYFCALFESYGIEISN